MYSLKLAIENHLKVINTFQHPELVVLDYETSEFIKKLKSSAEQLKKSFDNINKKKEDQMEDLEEIKRVLNKSITPKTSNSNPISKTLKDLKTVDELVKEIKDIISTIDKDQNEINYNNYLIGRYLAKLKGGKSGSSFQRLLWENKIYYEISYAYFLIRLSELFDVFPKLLESNLSIHWFKRNIKKVKEIVNKEPLDWKIEEEMATVQE